MVFDFKNKEMKRMVKEQEKEANASMSYGFATSQDVGMDTQSLIERRDMLIQLSKWQQDRSVPMQSLFLKLCGYHYDANKKKLVETEWDKGYVSLYGAHKILGFIESLDRNVMLANWSEKNVILTLREAIGKPLKSYFRKNHQEIGLKINHADHVFWTVMNAVEPTYWRGWNDGERRKDREIIKIQELRHEGAEPKKKGVFGLS